MSISIDFLSWHFQRCEMGNLNLRFICAGRTVSEFLPLSTIFENPSEVSALLEKYRSHDSYFGVALREGTNGKKDGIVEIPSLWIDLDGAPLAKVTESPWRPSAILETSPSKFHVYWKLREPLSRAEIPEAEKLLKRLRANFGGDPAATDASRILRIPGTSNFKTSPPFGVAIRLMDGVEYNLSDFDDLPTIGTPLIPTHDDPTNDRIKKILACKFLEHCDKDRLTLPEPHWYGMISILAREPGGRDVIHSLSQGYPKYSPGETDQKILHALNAGPATCQRIKSLWNCGKTCGVTSPAGLAFMKGAQARPTQNEFPKVAIGGLAGEFADLYSAYLESPWSFLAFNFLACFGNIVADRVTLASEIRPQPRLYVIDLGESADDRKSESIKKTVRFFEESMVEGEVRVCHGVGSAEGLAKKLSEIRNGPKKLVLIYDELKSFVGKAMIEGATLLPAVNSFFDGNRFHSATKTHSVELNDVYLSVLGASTIETFGRMWTPAFLDIGFLNRLWLVKDHGERKFSIPREIPEAEIRRLGNELGAVLKKFPEMTKLSVTPGAQEIFDAWYFGVEPSPFAKRLDTYGLRFMILLAVNESKSVVDEEVASKVVSLLEWQLRVRREVDPIDAEGSIARMEEMIRRVLANGPMSKRDLQRKVNYQRAGIYIWNSAIRNLQGAREVLYDHKTQLYRSGT